MKKILSLVLVVVMIMAMSIPAFAATTDDVAPCIACNGNHTYDEAVVQTTYEYSRNGCVKVVTRHYKCRYCTSAYTAPPEETTLPHNYNLYDATCDGTTQTHYYKCSRCKHIDTESVRCPNAVHSGTCTRLPV